MSDSLCRFFRQRLFLCIVFFLIVCYNNLNINLGGRRSGYAKGGTAAFELVFRTLSLFALAQ